MESPNDLFLMLKNHRVGDTMTLTLLRDVKYPDESNARSRFLAAPRLIAKRSGGLALCFVREIARGNLIFITFVGGDDLLHQMMTRDVFFGEVDEADAVYALENTKSFL